MKTCTACATTQPYPRIGHCLAGIGASRSSSNGGTPVVTALTETASGSFSGDGTSAAFSVNVGGSASAPTTTLTETNTTDLNGLTVTTDDIDSLDSAIVTAIASANNSSAPLYSASWTYNSAGDLLSETLTDSDGDTTAWTFNIAGQLTSRTLAYGTPEAATTTFGYDANGNLTSVTDPDGNVTTYTYNAQGQETSMTDPLGNTQTMAYNDQGQLIEQTNRDGLSETYAYNAAGQMVQENWYAADGTLTDQLNFSYNTAGQLVSAGNDEGTYTFSYDAQGQVIGVTEPFGLSLTFTYDSNGNRVEVQDSFGGTTQSSYDAANQLVSELFTETGQPTLLIDQSYNPDGTVANQTYYSDATGTNVVATTDYGYDAYGDVTSIVQTNGSGTVLGDYTYSYDTSGDYVPTPTVPSSTPSGTAALLAAFLEPPQPASSVSSETDNGVTTDYSYDASNQLVSYGGTTQSYDLNGNRNGPGYVIGPDNQLLSDGTYNYTYDADGNEASKTNIATGDQWVYGYNNADQLVSAVETTASGTIETQVAIQYDVFGNRLQEQVWTPSAGWTTTRYAYDAWDPATPSGVGNENWKVWATLDGNNSLETRYINGDALDQVFAQLGAGGSADWYLTDRLGSTHALVDNNGNVVDAIDYDAFGNIVSQTNPSAQPLFMFAGMAWDEALDLDYDRERFYGPFDGRFISQDPDQFPAGDSDLYRYVGNDPTNATDPSGDFWSYAVTAAFALWDTGQWVSGGISGEEYATRMAINGAVVVADTLAGGGFTGGGQIVRAGGAAARVGAQTLPRVAGVAAAQTAVRTLEVPKAINQASKEVMDKATQEANRVFSKSDSSTPPPKGLSRETPHLEDGNAKEGWQHIQEGHIPGGSANHGDLFAPGTTRAQIEKAAKELVEKGNRISDPARQIQTYQRRMSINGKSARYRVVVDSADKNRIITMFPVEGGQ